MATEHDPRTVLSAIVAITPPPNPLSPSASPVQHVFWLNEVLYLANTGRHWPDEKSLTLLRYAVGGSMKMRSFHLGEPRGWILALEFRGSNFATHANMLRDHFQTVLQELERGEQLTPMPTMSLLR